MQSTQKAPGGEDPEKSESAKQNESAKKLFEIRCRGGKNAQKPPKTPRKSVKAPKNSETRVAKCEALVRSQEEGTDP